MGLLVQFTHGPETNGLRISEDLIRHLQSTGGDEDIVERARTLYKLALIQAAGVGLHENPLNALQFVLANIEDVD